MNQSTQTSDKLVWIDLEMTGLDVASDRIVEIAVVVTDNALNILAEGPNLIIHEPQEFLDALSDDRKEFMKMDGLWYEVPKSTNLLPDVEDTVVSFLEEHIAPGESPLCGNTISKDRQFLERYMPCVTEMLHYRNIDVSSIKELARRWKPELLGQVKKKETHRARDDIYESIEELKVYREHLFQL
jgi:oligoribonuclease